MMADQAERLRQLSTTAPLINRQSERQSARVLAVTSGKGGVGKSNLVVNLALALAEQGQRVLIIDADIGMANVEVILGCPALYSLTHLLNGSRTLEEVVVIGPRNIRFLSGGSGLRELGELNKLDVQRVINQIMFYDQQVDYILFDTGAGIGETVLNFVLAADEVLLVTTPEPTALTDAYALIKTYAYANGQAPIRLVVNRVSDQGEGMAVAEKLMKVAQQFLDFPMDQLGYVLDDSAVGKAIRRQKPLMVQYPDTDAARCIDAIAQRLLYGEMPENLHPSGISGFFRKLLQRI